MAKKSHPAASYELMQGDRNFNDNEATSDFNISDLGELPPTPTVAPSNRSFDVLGSLTDVSQQDAFRALYGFQRHSEVSLEIAMSSQDTPADAQSALPALATAADRPSSESLSIEWSGASDQEDLPSLSRQSLGSRESLQVPLEEGEGWEPSTTPEPAIVWQSSSPLLMMRNVSLIHGQRVLVTELNLDISRDGIHIVICDERFCRRLLLAMLTATGSKGAVRMEGSMQWAEDAPSGRPQLCMLHATELLLPLGEYLHRALESEATTRIDELLTTLQLEPLKEKMRWFLHDLEPYERRLVAILHASLRGSPLLCMDDPLDELQEEGASLLLRVLRQVAARQPILIMAPELGQLSTLTERVAWHHGNRLVTSIADGATESSVADDSESVSPPAVTPSESAVRPSPLIDKPETHRQTGNGQQGPRGFRWLVEGKLAGTPEPGILFDIDYDLSLLRSAGVTMLVTLTEQPIPETLLEPHGLKSLYFPIVDMNVPSCRATEDLCSLVELALERGEVIAFHCKAGLGRTGTLLVSYLIWEGAPPAEALAVARTIEPGWVQSDIQEQYLFQFAEYCRSRRPPYQS
jgi:atypical dual specificity phosphatase